MTTGRSKGHDDDDEDEEGQDNNNEDFHDNPKMSGNNADDNDEDNKKKKNNVKITMNNKKKMMMMAPGGSCARQWRTRPPGARSGDSGARGRTDTACIACIAGPAAARRPCAWSACSRLTLAPRCAQPRTLFRRKTRRNGHKGGPELFLVVPFSIFF